MKRTLSAATLAAICFVLSAPLYAQTVNAVKEESGETLILSMNRALNMALEKNLTVLSAQEKVTAAQGERRAAGAPIRPRFTVSGSEKWYEDVPGAPDREESVQASVSQLIYAGGKNRARLRAAADGVNASRAAMYDTRENVALDVWNAYCQVLYRKEVLRTTRNALEYYTKAEHELKERVLYGLSTNLDLTRVRQRCQNARAENITAENMLVSSRIELCRLLRLGPTTSIALSGRLEEGLPENGAFEDLPSDRKMFFDEVLARRGDYQVLLHGIKAKRENVRVAESGMKPTLQLSSGYRFAHSSHGATVKSSDDNQWISTLSLDVPLYDGGASSGMAKSARAEVRRAENALAECRERISAELADSYLSFQNALSALEAARANVKLAGSSLKYAETGYREGVNTQLDVLQARSELTDAYRLQAKSLLDCRAAQAKLWKAEGFFIEKAMGSFAPSVEKRGK